jgi:DNA polymerase-3 subunit delta'
MSTLNWKLLLGQERIKEVLSNAFSNDKLGHAYLLCGESGVGTFACALEMAMAIHCENRETKPCMQCSSCLRIKDFAHPDLHVVMPVALQKEFKGSDGKIADAGWVEISRLVKCRFDEPYQQPVHAALPSIPVEWIRELTHAIRRGAVEKGKNVVIVDGVETMQPESANAMLKTLEEPPSGTIMFLCAARLHSVLPTILSRCQLLRFSALSPEIIEAEVIKRYSILPNDSRIDQLKYSGSLSKAVLLTDDNESVRNDFTGEFLRSIAERDMQTLFSKIDQMSEADEFTMFENMFVTIVLTKWPVLKTILWATDPLQTSFPGYALHVRLNYCLTVARQRSGM